MTGERSSDLTSLLVADASAAARALADVSTAGQETAQRLSAIPRMLERFALEASALSLTTAIQAARGGQHGASLTFVAQGLKDMYDQAKRTAAEAEEVVAALAKQLSSHPQQARALVGSLDRLGQAVKKAEAVVDAARSAAAATAEAAATVKPPVNTPQMPAARVSTAGRTSALRLVWCRPTQQAD